MTTYDSYVSLDKEYAIARFDNNTSVNINITNISIVYYDSNGNMIYTDTSTNGSILVDYYTIVSSYVDEAMSAKTDNRPQFLKMINDAKSNTFNAVICHKLDGFARNRYDWPFIRKNFQKAMLSLSLYLKILTIHPNL